MAKRQKLSDYLFQKLSDDNLTDCTFEFSVNNKRKLLKAHKLTLATISPVFYEIFFGEKKAASSIKIDYIPYDVFQKFIHLMYDQKIELANVDEAIKLYDTGKKYAVDVAVDYARSYILENCDDSCTSSILHIATSYTDLALKQKACEGFFEAIHNTTKKPEFFVETSKLEANGFTVMPLNAPDLQSSLDKLNIQMQKISTPKEYVEHRLSLVRFLTTRAQEEFQSIVAESSAKFQCSLTWTPLTKLSEDTKKLFLCSTGDLTHCKGHYNGLGLCAYCAKACIPLKVVESDNGVGIIEKYKSTDLKLYELKDAKEMESILSSNLPTDTSGLGIFKQHMLNSTPTTPIFPRFVAPAAGFGNSLATKQEAKAMTSPFKSSNVISIRGSIFGESSDASK